MYVLNTTTGTVVPYTAWRRADWIVRQLYRSAVRDGGATVVIVDNGSFRPKLEPITHGLAVGGAAEPVTIRNARAVWMLAGEDPEELQAAVIWALDKTRPGTVLGSWIDNDGTLWLDVVTIEDDRDRALTLAAERGESAVYDLDAGQEIPVAA